MWIFCLHTLTHTHTYTKSEIGTEKHLEAERRNVKYQRVFSALSHRALFCLAQSKRQHKQNCTQDKRKWQDGRKIQKRGESIRQRSRNVPTAQSAGQRRPCYLLALTTGFRSQNRSAYRPCNLRITGSEISFVDRIFRPSRAISHWMIFSPQFFLDLTGNVIYCTKTIICVQTCCECVFYVSYMKLAYQHIILK